MNIRFWITQLSLGLVGFLFVGCFATLQLRGPVSSKQKPGAVAFCMYSSNGMNATSHNFVEKVGEDKFVKWDFKNDFNGYDQDVIYYTDYCYIVGNLKAGRGYSFDQVKLVNRSAEVTLNLSPAQMYNTMPIKVKAGQITFIGVYNISVKWGNEISGEPNSVSFIKDNNKTIRKNVAKHAYGKHSKDDRGAEINVLEWLAKNQKEGYWHDIAMKKLKRLKK